MKNWHKKINKSCEILEFKPSAIFTFLGLSVVDSSLNLKLFEKKSSVEKV
jgi:hypothetical protein